VLISPNPSTGVQSASTTLPTISFQTGTSRVLPLDLAFSHSLIFKKPSSITTHTKCSSRFKAIPLAPESNSITSL